MSGESLLTEFEKLKEDNLLQRSRILELEQRLHQESELRNQEPSFSRQAHYETVIRRQDPQLLQSEGVTPKKKNCACECHYSPQKEYITVEDISPNRRHSRFQDWRHNSHYQHQQIQRPRTALDYSNEDRSAQALYHRNVKYTAAPTDSSSQVKYTTDGHTGSGNQAKYNYAGGDSCSYYPRYTYQNIPEGEIVNGRRSWYLPYHWWVGGSKASSKYFSSRGFRQISHYNLGEIESEVAQMKRRQNQFENDEHYYRRKGGYYHYGFMKPLLGRSKSEGRFGRGGRYYYPQGQEADYKEWLHFNY